MAAEQIPTKVPSFYIGMSYVAFMYLAQEMGLVAYVRTWLGVG